MAAIYCPPWPKDLEVTTTLFPVVMVDVMQFNASVTSGWMTPIAKDNLQCTRNVQSASYVQERWFYYDGPYLDNLQTAQDVLSANYVQERWFYTDGPYLDNLQTTRNVISASYVSKLVTVKTGSSLKPYEELQMSITINNTCTMDLI